MLAAMRLRTLVALLAMAVVCQTACNKEKLGVRAIGVLGPGVINDPRNKSLRFDILKFGLEQFCYEMTRRGAPLKLEDDQPVMGRFFATNCQSRVIDDENRQSLVVQYEGKGYAWTNVSLRIGFSAAGVTEYAADFQVHEGALYVYFRPRNIDSAAFTTHMVESKVATAGAQIFGVDFDAMGTKIVRGQIERGFTVIRYSKRGETDFGLGIVSKGKKPFHPFQIRRSEKKMLANDRTEVHSHQHDFVGPLEVKGSGKALYVTATLDGAPGVDVLIVPKGVGDLMIQNYVTNPGPTGLTAPPLLDEPLETGRLWKRFVPVGKGLYYLIFDHSRAMGRTTPPQIAGDDRAAKIDYLIQLGDAP